MAYQTGTATSPTDLLQKLVTWLVARGWTSNMSQADGTGWRAHLSKGSTYANFRATPGNESIWAGGAISLATQIGIGMYLGTGYSGAAAWSAQAGGPIGNGAAYTLGTFMQTPAGAMTAYYFFDDGADNILVVVERTSGIFTHLAWGTTLAKAGAWTGGAYFTGPISAYWGGGVNEEGSATLSAYCPGHNGSRPNGNQSGFVRADVDTFTGKWVGISSLTTANIGYTGKNGASAIPGANGYPVDIPNCSIEFMSRQTSSLNSQANLIPVRWYAQRDGGGYSMLGTIPSIFATNATTKGYANGEEILIGADTYKVFPNFAVKKVS